MVKAVKRQTIMWMAPTPLWGERSAWMRLPRQHQMSQPVILRFGNDMFMDEMIAMLTHTPWRLSEWVARPETWRNPMPTPKPVEITRPLVNLPDSYNKTKRLVQNYSRDTRVTQIRSLTKTPASLPQLPSDEPVKLYQAAHQRYYVVTGSLISEEKGYPDYLMNLSKNEQATFVVRALKDNQDGLCEEYGFVSTSRGMAWKKLGTHGDENAAVSVVLPNEEKLPLFPVTYPDRCERYRQVLGGLIPVNKRDEWMDAPLYSGNRDVEIASPVTSNDGGEDLFKEILYSDVIAPWKALISQAETDKRKNTVNSGSFPNFDWDPAAEAAAKLDTIRNVRTARDEIQTSSWYVLLDFARFLNDHLPNVWKKINEGSGVDPMVMTESILSEGESRLIDSLMETRMDMRLFMELAVENLAVGGFETNIGVSMWDRFLDFWKLEIYLKLSWVLYESENHVDKFMDKVASNPWLTIPFKHACLSFLGSFVANSPQTFLDFARNFGVAYPTLKTISVQNAEPSIHTDYGRLINILKKIKLPSVQANVVRTISEESSGATDSDILDLDKSMWDLLSFYWAFETHVDQNVAETIADNVAGYLHSEQAPDVEDLSDQVLEWFYGDMESGAWYSFLQFATDLEAHCPMLHMAAIYEVFGKHKSIDDSTEKLITFLQTTEITETIHNELFYPNTDKRKVRIIPSLVDALIEITHWAEALEEVDTPYDRSIQADSDVSIIDERWPDFLFPLTDPGPLLTDSGLLLEMEKSHIVPESSDDNPDSLNGVEYLQYQLDQLAERIDNLVRIEKQITGNGTSSVLSLDPLLNEKNVQDKQKPRFVVRFVFEKPHCGNLFQPLVSRSSCKLEMAPFFDPDAPARPVRIRMPLDISPAGLRKYKKNAMVLFSDMMCGKVKKTGKLSLADLVLSVLPWPFHKDLPDVGNTGPCRSNGENMGMFCSLSIPIVTLCALVLLSIMVNLFNIFFKWIPWFFMCFPLPGFKGKDN